MIERLGRLVAIRSVSREEGVLADAVCHELQEAGLDMHRQGNNLWCEIGDDPRPRLLLNSHLDTVPRSDGWTGDPWTLRRIDDRLIGLGANDAKGCVTAMIEAVLSLGQALQRGERLGGTVVLALTAEEEIAGAGLATIITALSPLDAAIVGEPTGMVPMIAQRGLLIVRGVARGRSAHPASTPPESADNAILVAARELAGLAEFDWGPPHPLLGRCHGHVTMIRGGVARNVIPDACEFYVDIRTTPVESHAELYERLRRHLRCELDVHSDRLAPVQTDADEPIVKAVLRAVPGAVPGGSPAMSDMVFLGGIPSVKIGPGDSRRSHTPDEYILLGELRAGVTGYARIVGEYFKMMGAAGGVSAAEPASTVMDGSRQ